MKKYAEEVKRCLELQGLLEPVKGKHKKSSAQDTKLKNTRKSSEKLSKISHKLLSSKKTSKHSSSNSNGFKCRINGSTQTARSIQTKESMTEMKKSARVLLPRSFIKNTENLNIKGASSNLGTVKLVKCSTQSFNKKH